MSEPEPSLDEQIASFSRANHHRWAIVYLVAGIACIVAGALFAVLGYSLPDSTTRPGSNIRVLVYGIGGVVVGVVMIWRAVGVWRGKREDVDG